MEHRVNIFPERVSANYSAAYSQQEDEEELEDQPAMPLLADPSSTKTMKLPSSNSSRMITKFFMKIRICQTPK
jgi:hypothetical protein